MKLRIIFYILSGLFSGKFKTRRELELFQARKIKKHLAFLKRQSPFYANLSFSELSQLPLMNKALAMKNFDSLNTAGLKKEAVMAVAIQSEESRDFRPEINGIAVGLSSGTSGSRGIFVVSEQERARYVAVIFKKVLRGLPLRRTKIALFFRANNNLYESLGSLLIEFRFFDLTKNFETQLASLQQFSPHILAAPPSLLGILADKKIKKGLACSPELIYSVAEVLEDDVRQKIKTAFGVKVHQLYQCTEGFLASTCHHGNLHLHEEYIHIEKKWIDRGGRRFIPVITDFTRKTQPVVRYELNDILVEGDACPCGAVQTHIGKIEGRCDDVFCFKNRQGTMVPVFPDQFRNTVIIASPGSADYQVIQTGAGSISVFLETGEAGRAAEETNVISALRSMLLKKDIENVAIVPTRTKEHTPASKYRRIINTTPFKHHDV